jgi:hypothetical protein
MLLLFCTDYNSSVIFESADTVASTQPYDRAYGNMLGDRFTHQGHA